MENRRLLLAVFLSALILIIWNSIFPPVPPPQRPVPAPGEVDQIVGEEQGPAPGEESAPEAAPGALPEAGEGALSSPGTGPCSSPTA